MRVSIQVGESTELGFLEISIHKTQIKLPKRNFNLKKLNPASKRIKLPKTQTIYTSNKTQHKLKLTDQLRFTLSMPLHKFNPNFLTGRSSGLILL